MSPYKHERKLLLEAAKTRKGYAIFQCFMWCVLAGAACFAREPFWCWVCCLFMLCEAWFAVQFNTMEKDLDR